jgi:hypothetical protein
MALQAQGRGEFDGIMGSGRTMALQTWGRRRLLALWARERRGVHSVVGLGRMTLLWARERCHRFWDEACIVDGSTTSGREDGGA